jgi:hypothetical protein
MSQRKTEHLRVLIANEHKVAWPSSNRLWRSSVTT